MHHEQEIIITAGQRTRIICNITAPEGTDVTLHGGVTYIDEHNAVRQLEMQVSGHELMCGVLPVGRWVYEVRAGGRTLLYGAIRVKPTPLEPLAGISVWNMDATLDTADVAVTLGELPGAEGRNAYQLACEHGFEGTEEEWLASLKGEDGAPGATAQEVADEFLKKTAVPVNFLTTEASGGNASFQAAQFPCPATGRLKRVSILCRSTGYMREDPLYFVVGVRGLVGGINELTRKAVSRNEVAQQHGCRSIWEFDGFDVQRGEMLYMYASLDLSGDSYADMVVGCTAVATNGAEEGQCQGTNGSWFNLLVVAELEIEQEARPVLLTEGQQERLRELLG